MTKNRKGENAGAKIGAEIPATGAENVAENDDRLSWGDTVFLNLEREDMPLNVASVCVFEREIPLKDSVRFVESRLPLLPCYLKRVVPPPLNIGLPRWEYDPGFDIRNHVKEVTLKHGSEAELKALAGKIFSTVMDRQHPLWDLTFVHGLKGKRSALIFRLHHCLADGIAGVGIMHVLMDTTPAVPRLPRRKLQIPVTPPRGTFTALTSGIVETYSDLVKRVLDGYVDVTSMAGRLAANGEKTGSGEFSHLLPELNLSTERLRFNVLYRGPQKFGWVEIPLAEIKGIKSACGTSVNDVILALVTATIRRYLELHGDDVKGRQFRMMIPVNLRGNESPGELGNRISLVPVTVPLDIRDARKLLATVHERTELLKRAHAAELVSLAGGWLSMIPSSAQSVAGHVISRLPFTPFNMVCTNVPGPQYPLYFLGRKLLHCYPYVPIGGEMALNCAILTYNGTAYFGFSGEVNAVPDLPRLETFLKASFAELRKAAGVRPPHKEDRSRKKKVSAKAKAKATATSKTSVAAPPLAPASASAPVPVAASVPVRPAASGKLPTTVPSVMEEKVLARLIV
jgi:diacylglycerol O-acyltransferase